ncbi:AmmeMemoRadiSam system protein A [Sulfurospirillum sp. T05]|uniref:AmmeMemoRadiSam system protein A n=1 Tax=Sulfurospirillum tamanense TaxID=2813362 RepID=A0ABS2WTY2_9BACT|nr:AmmeMemoRadiSam system protein A [Sulfurospirillum tamanensis]MBN2965119.1 AmmeMemoRadiSam system protein A [Sulfurospirillum tamanensis]
MHAALLSIAHHAIEEVFDPACALDTKALKEQFPELLTPRATFVTLTLNGELRGCIGTLEANHPLLDDLIANAKAAAFEDPRFYPLSLAEFEKTVLEISLLTPPEKLFYHGIADLKAQVVPGEDGIILQLGRHRATFLPQVWEQLPSFAQFFSHLCHKAGLETDCLASGPDIYRYRVEKIR